MVGFRRLITSSCHARAIAVLSTCVVTGQAADDDSALSSENKAQREMNISAITRQRMLDYCSSGDARWSPALSISAPIFFETLGAWPVVCCCTGAPVASGATVLVSGRVAAGDRVTLCGVGFSCCGAVGVCP